MAKLANPGPFPKAYDAQTASKKERFEMKLHLLAQEAYAKSVYPAEWVEWRKLYKEGQSESQKAARQFFNRMVRFNRDHVS